MTHTGGGHEALAQTRADVAEIRRILAEMRAMRDEAIQVRDAALLATSDMPRCPGCGGDVPGPAPVVEEVAGVTNPADPPPVAVPVGSPEGADRLRAAMEDLDAESCGEAGSA